MGDIRCGRPKQGYLKLVDDMKLFNIPNWEGIAQNRSVTMNLIPHFIDPIILSIFTV